MRTSKNDTRIGNRATEMKWKSLDHALNWRRAGALGSTVSRVGDPAIGYEQVGEGRRIQVQEGT